MCPPLVVPSRQDYDRGPLAPPAEKRALIVMVLRAIARANHCATARRNTGAKRRHGGVVDTLLTWPLDVGVPRQRTGAVGLLARRANSELESSRSGPPLVDLGCVLNRDEQPAHGSAPRRQINRYPSLISPDFQPPTAKKWRPRRDLNPCRRRERPVSWARLDDGDAMWPSSASSCEPCWTRTSDPLLKRQLLYHLS